MTTAGRAEKLARALVKALQDGAELPVEVADELRTLLPKRKRGGQKGARKVGSARAQGREAAVIYTHAMALGANAHEALDTIREALGLVVEDRALYEAMATFLEDERASSIALVEAASAADDSLAALEQEHRLFAEVMHAKVSGLPVDRQQLLYDAMGAGRDYIAATHAYFRQRSNESQRRRVSARDEAARALAALDAAPLPVQLE